MIGLQKLLWLLLQFQGELIDWSQFAEFNQCQMGQLIYNIQSQISIIIDCQMSTPNLSRCPYVPKHKVPSRNLLAHLQKCSQKLSPAYLRKFAACKYNNAHIFSIYEIAAHELACPNRHRIEILEDQLLKGSRVLVQEISRSSQQTSISQHKNTEEEEDWNNRVTKQYVPPHQPEVTQQLNNYEEEEIIMTRQIEEDDIDSYIKFNSQQFKDQLEAARRPTTQNSALTGNQLHITLALNKNKKDLQLDECKQCSAILCDTNSKLWKNKKLAKYLKAYSKLSQQHEQIKEFLRTIKNIIVTKDKKQDQPHQTPETDTARTQMVIPKQNKDLVYEGMSKIVVIDDEQAKSLKTKQRLGNIRPKFPLITAIKDKQDFCPQIKPKNYQKNGMNRSIFVNEGQKKNQRTEEISIIEGTEGNQQFGQKHFKPSKRRLAK